MEYGDYINIHLTDPVERLWGRLIRLSNAGVIMRGIDVKEIEAFKYQFRKQEKEVFPQTAFFPMRRVQKMDIDEPLDQLPSVIEALVEATGKNADEIINLKAHSARMGQVIFPGD